MAKRKAGRAAKKAAPRKKATCQERRAPARSRPPARPPAGRRSCAGGRRAASKAKTARKATAARKKTAAKVKRAPAKRTARAAAPKSSPRSTRAKRRELDDTVPTPPSSLDMNRRGSAARTGRAEMAEERTDHANMTPAITGGDVDVNVENAYFSGDEAPGGDNPTPDQDIVDDIGKALGVEYQDNEELRGERQGRRARQAPLGARSGILRRLPGPEVSAAGRRAVRGRGRRVLPRRSSSPPPRRPRPTSRSCR